MAAAASTSGARGELRYDEPLARHTAWGIGGPARRFYVPASVADLARFLAELPAAEEIFFLGLGSNLLVRDGGIDATVIATEGLAALERLDAGHVRAEAGVPCPKVARFCARLALGGAEFFAGIPGTVGGALSMNAGAFGGETWDLVARVETVDRCGRLRTRRPAEYRVGYRTVVGPSAEWFVAAVLALAPGDDERGRARIRELLRMRAETQPLGTRNCGSVFRNPPGDHAARLIEASGLKGERAGAAVVSTKHANFIINEGGASARDVEALIARVIARVAEATGVALEPEVRVVGRALEEPRA
ncbi:MAG: UDP-N-acetylmuramate dehydrogenase [Gammaproteobacteria bacterium]|nr:UDP-N-acetylmuramate dehydrogenase [Gammaproteobacteria bacterium]